MDMKWHPIIDGDLSGIPKDEEFLFTVFDEEDRESFVICAYIIDYGGEYDGQLEVREASASGLIIHEAKNLKAWMDFPEPYNQNSLKTMTSEQLDAVIRALKKAQKMMDEVEY